MKKLDLENIRKQKEKTITPAGVMELRLPEMVEKQDEIKAAIDRLAIITENHEDYDFNQLKSILEEMSQKLDMEQLIKSLEKSLKQTNELTNTSQRSLVSKQNEGFSKLQKALESTNFTPKVVVKAADLLTEYRGSDTDIGEQTSYFGFLHSTGKWYIIRQSGEPSGSIRYTSGKNNYRQGWTRRAQHDYKYFDEVTL